MTVRVINGDCRDVLQTLPAESFDCVVTSPPEVLAYCAGIIDADGTIGIKRSTYGARVVGDRSQPSYSERVCVKQVEKAAVLLMKETFGGTLYLASPSTKNGNPLWAWQATDKRAANCLRAVLPYLRIKRFQAENCLALRCVKEESKIARVAAGRGHAGAAKRPVHLSDAMERAYLEAKRLNIVGVRHD